MESELNPIDFYGWLKLSQLLSLSILLSLDTMILGIIASYTYVLFSGMRLFVSAEKVYQVLASHSGIHCEGTPSFVFVIGQCADGTMCVDAVEPVRKSTMFQCAVDYISTMRGMFGSSRYILQEKFSGYNCWNFISATGFSASGNCERKPNMDNSTYYKAKLDINGTSSIVYYNDSQCSEAVDTQLVSNWTLPDDSCYGHNFKWYSSEDALNDHVLENSSSSKSTTSGSDNSAGISSNESASPIPDNENYSTGSDAGTIIGITCGVVVLVLFGLFIIYRRRSHDKSSSTLPTIPVDFPLLEAALRGQSGLWNDDVITAKRIPRSRVKVKKLLRRGAYGEVYRGVYNRQEVAVKMLLSSTRGNIQNVNDFLAEAKLTATMDHPHIVTFIGVAWDSLSDMCVVLEFMDGGDLRTLLNSYEATKRPIGFDKQKATIALHVCHALTYLHSLMPPVIHRDLKSRNILLNRNLEAKLTDFGVSKERLDQTMTAGVGTSLWMAPEVMLGERYDVKADMFSFGVMLSELDVHTLPYTQVQKQSLASTGRKVADATLLQKITAGEVQVEFSEYIPRSLVELGLACISVDPLYRPTTAEALYRLQVILVQEYS